MDTVVCTGGEPTCEYIINQGTIAEELFFNDGLLSMTYGELGIRIYQQSGQNICLVDGEIMYPNEVDLCDSHLLPSGEFRLYLSKGASVFSATSKDGISFKKDKGLRSSKGKGGVPGALVLKDGSVIL